MSSSVKDKVVIITGGAGAIGTAAATRLLQDGAKVVIADLKESAALQADLRKVGDVLCIQADVSSEADTLRLAKEVEAAYGRIDALINNAGLYTPKAFEEITLDDWRERLRVNLEGPFLCIKAVLPAMKRQKKGRIINIGSDTVWMGTPGLAHYVASKGGLLGLTRALATELGPLGISTAYVTPTLLDTPGTRAAFQQAHFDYVQGHTPLGKLEKATDVAGLLTFLRSDDAEFINGAAINIGGGISMH